MDRRIALLVGPLLAACQPATIDIGHDKDAPLYGSDGSGSGGGSGSGAGSGSDGSGGWGDDPTADISGEFRYAHQTDGGWQGAFDCQGWWSFTGSEASTDCPGCWYTLDAAYDVEFTFSPTESLMPVGCENSQPGYFATQGEYGDQYLSQQLGLWGVSSDYYGGEPVFLIGYDYGGYYDYGTYFYPLYGAELTFTDDRLEFILEREWTYGGYYYDDYYDYAMADDYTVRYTIAGYGTRR